MYQALYRKWRPQVFADVVGQEHITTTLTNEIQSGRHSHAYLFTGSRGTGKTTCAKIFAKAVNCEHPIGGDPCNNCETCRGLDSGSILDVIEIDAASNNGVDNIRDIRDEANFTPVNGKYRVYIIDEVHMLSQGAFNALLKTLEEPPEHVKFVLATTEVHKLPATVLSRCQRFDFRRITPEDIANRLTYVANHEDITLDTDAAMLIARLADGALRDALSIMDQCIGHSRNITVAVVNSAVGLAGRDYLFALSDAILQNNAASALSTINDLHNRSCDMERLCNELINHYRNIMICKAVKQPQTLIICSEQELREYCDMASAYSMDKILEVLNVFGDTVNNLHKGLNRRVETEMAIIKLCAGLQTDTDFIPSSVPTQSTHTTQAIPAAQPVASLPLTPESPAAHSHDSTHTSEETRVPSTQESDVQTPPTPVHISLTESLPEGLIPTNIWNALIREITSVDKPLIGTMNSAKAYKIGETLQILTDNMLLKTFVPMAQHRDIIYNATFTVLGEYLRPMIIEKEPDTDPLDTFINNLSEMKDSNQIDFSLFIEE